MNDYYRPTFRYQIGDPTTTRDSYICTMSSGAMALDYHTKGRIKVWGGNLDARDGRTSADGRHGTNLVDLQRAWASYGETLDIRSGQGWAGVKAALAEGRAVVLQGDYDRFTGADSCQTGFTLDHAVLLLPSTRQWAVVGDPLCKDYKTIAEGTVRAYAEKVNVGVQFAVTRAQPPQEQATTDMHHVKPGGAPIGTAKFVTAGHYVLSTTDPVNKRYGPRAIGETMSVMAAVNLVDRTGKPIDIDGKQPPVNNRDKVYLVDGFNGTLPWGASCFVLRSDVQFTPAASADADLVAKVNALAVEVTTLKAEVERQTTRLSKVKSMTRTHATAVENT